MLYESLFGKLLKLPPELLVYPAHDYKAQGYSTIGREIADNPRLQKRDRATFVAMMRELNLAAPTHLTEALRSNISGGKTVAGLLAEAGASVLFMALEELNNLDQNGAPWPSMASHGTLPRNPDGEHAAKQE